MRGIRHNPLMPPNPLCIGVSEGSHPENEGDRPKTLFFILYLNTKPSDDKVPLYRQQSTTLSASKYTFVIDKVPSRRPWGYSSRPTRIVLTALESSPRSHIWESHQLRLTRGSLEEIPVPCCSRVNVFRAVLCIMGPVLGYMSYPLSLMWSLC